MAGKTFLYGDNVDTDVILPARYLALVEETDLAKHCMEDIDPGFAAAVKKGDVIVAGENFGCGSSREHAPLSIKACGVSCVIAASFSRIFYRNAINIGLPILESHEACSNIRAGDMVEADPLSGRIRDLTTGKEYCSEGFPTSIKAMIDAGGLLAYLSLEENKREK